METESPFCISDVEVRELEGNESFRIVRKYLSVDRPQPFCETHRILPTELLSTFVLHRDILHAILLPILQIRSCAATYAADALCARRSHPSSPTCTSRTSTSPSRSPLDLELAFRGPARGAFSWLQCFLTEEHEWSSTLGCPACTVLKVLHAEPFIRIVIASCQLSGYLQELLKSRKPSGLETVSYLPDFEFWRKAVQSAVSEDEFWGMHFWDEIESRAVDLEEGVKDLIAQCSASCHPSPHLQHAHSTPALSESQSRSVSTPSVLLTTPAPRLQSRSVKKGKFLERQIELKHEEQRWMGKIVQACWDTLLKEAAMERKGKSVTRGMKPALGGRQRNLTT